MPEIPLHQSISKDNSSSLNDLDPFFGIIERNKKIFKKSFLSKNGKGNVLHVVGKAYLCPDFAFTNVQRKGMQIKDDLPFAHAPQDLLLAFF